MGLNWHEDFIVHLARLLRPKLYVELGLFQCALFNRIIPYAEKSIGVDRQPEAGTYMKQSQDTRFIIGTTQEFAKELEAKPLQINMLFIDADYINAAVLRDFHEFFPYIAPHGLILLHDSYLENAEMMQPGLNGVANQAVEILGWDTRSYELMTIPVSRGLSIRRKRQIQLS